jgi:hypothetical protein
VDEVAAKTAVDWLENPFCDLLADLVFFESKSLDAHAQKNDAIENTFAKAAILEAVLVVECAINGPISRYDYSKKVLEQLDKFPALDKYDFFLSSRKPGEKLDRGRDDVQSVDDLIRVRNSLVHPKLRSYPGQIGKVTKTSEGLDHYHVDPLEEPTTPHLKIPLRYTSWRHQHAHVALIKVVGFMNYFFVDLLKWSTDHCMLSFCKAVRTGKDLTTLVPEQHFAAFRATAKRLGIEFRFLPLDA